MKRISSLILFSLLLFSCSSPITIDIELENASTRESPTEDITPTHSEPQKEPTRTSTPTNTPTLTPEPEPTKIPIPSLNTYGHKVEWLDPKMQTILEDLVDITYERFLPLDGFSFEPKGPIVNIKELPEGTVCYGWEHEDSINCLYAEKGVDYYCDDDQDGWPVCYPPNFNPETDVEIESEYEFADGYYLVLIEGSYRRAYDKEKFLTYLTDNMDLGLGGFEQNDFILGTNDQEGINFSACRQSEMKDPFVVFAVPLARYGGPYAKDYLDIKGFGGPESSCDGEFTIWDLNP